MRSIRILTMAALGATLALWAMPAKAQAPAVDPSARLRQVLPADVADRVLARIAEARARQLPAQALENRALKFAARGVVPAEIERAIGAQADRMASAAELLSQSRSSGKPTGEEVEAAAEAMRQGVDGAAVSALAKSAPSGRSLAVPLFVIGNLVDRGLPSDEALARVRDRLAARASDAELEGIVPERGAAADAAAQRGMNRAGGAGMGRAPVGVPRNGGASTVPTRPVTPPPPPRGRP